MSTFSEIHSALQKAVANGLFGLPIQYEGIKLDHGNAPYIRATILPNTTEYATLGSCGSDKHTGILQLDLFYPNNKGVTAMIAKADTINDYFHSSREFPGTNLNVRIGITSIGPKLNEEGWIMQPISIDYYAYANRKTA